MEVKKNFCIILLVALVIGVLSGCTSNTNSTSADQGQEPLEIKVAAPAGAPTLSLIRMFKENPSFGEHITVNYESVKSPDLMASRIISGEIDIAVVPTNLAATLNNRGVNYKLAASSIWGILYIVGNEPISGWEDLRGKEIYTMGRGLTPDLVLRYLLESNGLDPENDVTLTYVGEATELASAFIAGKSTISVIPEPALSNVMIKKDDALILLDLQQEWTKLNNGSSSYPQASLIIKNEIVEEYPEFVEMFLQEYEYSILWLSENAEKAAQYSEDLETGLSKEAVINGLKRSNIRFSHSTEARDAIDQYLSVLFEYSPEAIGGKLPDAGFYLEKE